MVGMPKQLRCRSKTAQLEASLDWSPLLCQTLMAKPTCATETAALHGT